MNEKIVIAKIALSGNPDTEVVNSVDGINGKLNKTEDGRLFAMVTLEDRSNPFSFTRRSMMISQNDSGKWPAFTPKQLHEQIEKATASGNTLTVKGETLTFEVEPYSVNGVLRKRDSIIVLEKENYVNILRQRGHKKYLSVNSDGEEVWNTIPEIERVSASFSSEEN